MLRLNLLRGLDPDSPPQRVPSGKKPGRSRGPVVFLLALLALGGSAIYLLQSKPEGLAGAFDALTGGKAARAAEAARADSLRLESLRAEASRLVETRQLLVAEWLRQLEALPPENDYVLAHAAFTENGAFVLRGTARTGEALSGLQEALVLIPGMDLRESRAQESAAGPRGAFDFQFSGTVDPAGLLADTAGEGPGAAPVNRVSSSAAVESELARLADTAKGIALRAAGPAAPFAAGGLRGLAVRLTGSLDTSGIAGLRARLEDAGFRGSPLAARRLVLENRGGRKTVTLDAMAFIP